MEALDTLEVAKDLRTAGFTDAQAEALTRAVRKAQNLDISNLATKADLQATKADLQAEIASVKTELRAEIASVKAELRAEIALFRTELRAEIKAVRSDLQIEIAGIRTDMLRWIIGAIGVQTLAIIGTMLALAKLFTH